MLGASANAASKRREHPPLVAARRWRRTARPRARRSARPPDRRTATRDPGSSRSAPGCGLAPVGEQAVACGQVVQRGVGVQPDPRGEDAPAQAIEVGGDDAGVGRAQIGQRRPRREQDEAERRPREIERRVLGPAAQRGQQLEVLRDGDALVQAIELVLREALDADQERRDRDPRGRRGVERAGKPARAGEQPVGAGLEHQGEAAEAVGGARLEQLGQVAERLLIAQHQPGHRGCVPARVGDLRAHRGQHLGLGPGLVVVAGGAERAAAADAVGDRDAGVARVGAGVGLVRAAGVAVDGQRAVGGQAVAVDHQRIEIGRVGGVGHRGQRAEAGAPPVGGAGAGAGRQGRARAGQVVEQVGQRAGLDLVGARRIVERVLAAPVHDRRVGQRRHQRRRDGAAPHPLVDDRVEVGEAPPPAARGQASRRRRARRRRAPPPPGARRGRRGGPGRRPGPGGCRRGTTDRRGCAG
jgi:hypothetical protein